MTIFEKLKDSLAVWKKERENVVLGEEKATGLLHFWLRYAIFESSSFDSVACLHRCYSYKTLEQCTQKTKW